MIRYELPKSSVIGCGFAINKLTKKYEDSGKCNEKARVHLTGKKITGYFCFKCAGKIYEEEE